MRYRSALQPHSAHLGDYRAGVLLINLGTPAAPTAFAIRRYLREFLSDRRVVEWPRLLWWPILHGFILPFRPRRLAHAYAKIWSADGSPLLVYSHRLAEALGQRLNQALDAEIPVALAMTYGEPSVASALEALERAHVRHLLVIPLYPQYSATTTGASLDALGRALDRRRWLPALRTVVGYHDEPAYLSALADSVRAHWRSQGRGDHLLISFHGLPARSLEQGDPYSCFCRKTGRLLAEALGLSSSDYTVVFQSRFGPGAWLQPYADERIVELARAQVRRLDVICPGFAADCLETLEEVALRYAALFRQHGGEVLRYIRALNDQPAQVELLATLASRELRGWIPQPPCARHPHLESGCPQAPSSRR
jgi:ferrochelatase